MIGSRESVLFLDISTPDTPVLLSTYDHITSCDPVVASNNIAYSTLRSTRCRRGNADQLDVIDFSDINNPTILRSYNVNAPLGLAVVDEFLFLCQDNGLTMYGASNPENLVTLGRISFDNATALDVIPTEDFLIVTTNRGVFNVAYTDLGDMQVLGQIIATQ